MTETHHKPLPYGRLHQLRSEISIDFRNIPEVVGRDATLLRLVPPPARVLDVGAGDRCLLDQLRATGFVGEYASVDTDDTYAHDFSSLESVSGAFDVVVMREVIGHLHLNIFVDYAERILEILRPGGRLLITMPNVFSTWQLCDVTHVQHYSSYDLYALLRYVGYAPVGIYRIVPESRYLGLKRPYRRFHIRFFDLDYGGAILAVAVRQGADADLVEWPVVAR